MGRLLDERPDQQRPHLGRQQRSHRTQDAASEPTLTPHVVMVPYSSIMDQAGPFTRRCSERQYTYGDGSEACKGCGAAALASSKRSSLRP